MKNILIAIISILFLSSFIPTGDAPKVQELTTKTFKEKIWNYDTLQEWKYAGDKPAIVDLYAPWCGPCKRLAPILDEIQKELGDKIQIYKINTDKEKEISRIFNATSIPLMVFIPKEGNPFLVGGLRPKEQLIQIINEHLGVK